MAKQYKTCILTGMASKHMENFRIPSGMVDILSEDTGVMILIALYFIERDTKVSRTKLEAYLLMLDRICFEERGFLLFCWKLKSKRLENFKTITDFMLRKELINVNGRSYFELGKVGTAITPLFSMLISIRHWLDKLLQDYIDKTGTQTLSVVLSQEMTQQYMKALANARRIIDARNSVNTPQGYTVRSK